jgi:hypothetical protein
VLKKFSLKEFSCMVVSTAAGTYRVAKQETALADAAVANDEHLEQVVADNGHTSDECLTILD